MTLTEKLGFWRRSSTETGDPKLSSLLQNRCVLTSKVLLTSTSWKLKTRSTKTGDPKMPGSVAGAEENLQSKEALSLMVLSSQLQL